MDLEFGSLEMLALGTFWLCGVTTGVLLAAGGVSPRTMAPAARTEVKESSQAERRTDTGKELNDE